jgi:hypothetical protein
MFNFIAPKYTYLIKSYENKLFENDIDDRIFNDKYICSHELRPECTAKEGTINLDDKIKQHYYNSDTKLYSNPTDKCNNVVINNKNINIDQFLNIDKESINVFYPLFNRNYKKEDDFINCFKPTKDLDLLNRGNDYKKYYDKYFLKYLKYKNKYLNLKINI